MKPDPEEPLRRPLAAELAEKSQQPFRIWLRGPSGWIALKFFSLWLLEWCLSGFKLIDFLVRKRAIREEMAQLISRGYAEDNAAEREP